MRRYYRLLFFVLLLLAFNACGPSQRELAVKEIIIANKSVAVGDTMRAIEILDSIKYKYSGAEAQIGVARNRKNELYRILADNRKLQLIKNDSLIVALEQKFTKEKTEFDQYTQYIPKRQTFNRSWDRSFLRIHLDERGVMYLSSNYMGQEWLEHTGIRVYDGKLQAKSEKIPLESPLNNRSDFLDYKWERVSYMNGKADSVINFIVENPKLDLKCVFLGKRYYYILLEDYDIQAITDAYSLSQAILLKKELESIVLEYEAKINNH